MNPINFGTYKCSDMYGLIKSLRKVDWLQCIIYLLWEIQLNIN